MSSTQVFHKTSYSTALFHSFIRNNSFSGRAGYIFVPYGVHFFINSGPNTASLANVQLSFPALLSLCNLEHIVWISIYCPHFPPIKLNDLVHPMDTFFI